MNYSEQSTAATKPSDFPIPTPEEPIDGNDIFEDQPGRQLDLRTF